ncbi:hypothetical protein HN51_064588 [Arachis hypogaea]|uniref:RRM domain-containing protein n=1 Tax=Arachis hypogaea TaxID=3818 RepID=A0A444ZBF0_ARAHY|nr:flowering time control protein FPA [Arachis ipaensis]XP_025645363.1 flowering time control protein FPA [Arachis hypogaea]QHO05637.1 Flowering time control protein FPA [Arachis hypogaea]RYR11512.1 hypothetical protein Ahy_B04g069031 [Arachis hypogaea]
MSSRSGRDRIRRDYPPRNEDRDSGAIGRGNSSSGKNPPSRHLWVGNLSHNIVEDDLAHHFSQFGPLETIAFQPGRCYAFVNFKRDQDAIDAIRALQSFPLAGNTLRIEFAKADKPVTTARNEHYSRDERSSSFRGSPPSQRDFRGRHGSPPQPVYSEKSKLSDKSPEPSEILWIGFPSSLKVDESILRKSFSPFGEIVKITAFPGRTYAFVRFRSIASARRAKDTLNGKLFGNPRVHICFAKNEAGPSSSGRSSYNAPHSPLYRSSGREGSAEDLRLERSFREDHNISSPNFLANWDPGDSDAYDFNRGSSWVSGRNTYEKRKVGEKGTPPGFGSSHEIHEYMSVPSRERHGYLGDLPQRFPEKGAFFEDFRTLPEDVYYLREAKKRKTSSPPPDRELPEYPFSELERQKGVFPRLSGFCQHESFNNDDGNVAYRQTLDYPPNSPMASLDRHEGWKTYDNFQMGHGALQSDFVYKKRFSSEPDNSSLTEWNWEGTIAKGGTPVCRARCFPVGKALDMMLPEFLDCTARTGLDMLSKHYYQAVGVWVVFFVPGSDADIEFYNEFMHYLEEKQRAAVAKLDDKTTLFLVPPSDFSEKVLKVPGKLSISGVILRLEIPGLNDGPLHVQRETNNEKLLHYNGNSLYPKPSFPSVRIHSPSVSEFGSSGMSNTSFLGNKIAPSVPAVGLSEPHGERSLDYPPVQQQNPNWFSHNMQNSISTRIPPQLPSGFIKPTSEDGRAMIPRAEADANSNQHSSGISGIPNCKSSQLDLRPVNPLSVPVGSLQPEQLAQLAASLLEQQRQSGNSANASASNDPRQTNRANMPDSSSRPSQNYAVENLVNPEVSTSQFGQALQLQKQQQASNVPPSSHTIQREPQRGANGNQQVIDSSLQEEAEADPQKRLQATLQLAAVLLQQIQQGKGS